MKLWKNNKKEIEQESEREESQETNREKIRNNKSFKRWKLLGVTIGCFIAMIGIFFGAITYTSTPSFCANCHEMAPEHVTFQASAHNEIKCTQCHIEPGAKNLVVHKVESLKEVYYHIVGPPDPIVQTVAVTNESCEQCHSRNRLVTATGDLIVNHNEHVDKEIPCISCHSGVAHAKIVERGINGSSTYAAWTKENSKKLMGQEYEKPNMGTCIDCHDKVNQGKEPWKHATYILPENTHTKEKGKVNEVSTEYVDSPEASAGVLERNLPENTQKTILEALGQQKKDVKLSMECITCHQQIKVPENHDKKDWSDNHGNNAVEQLEDCLNCHKNSLWVKTLERQDIKTLLADKKQPIINNKEGNSVTRETSNNYFCYVCHATMPNNHKDRYSWLYDKHRLNSVTPEERKSCFVCHDNEKPVEGKSKAPSDVYCEFCHQQGEFEGEEHL
jgi:nitrate/TMAO reductase-like tetraheme cytochrome c subunit